jgi:hypothetical protein
MELALEIAFAAAVIVVAASLAAVAFARVRERLLLGLSVGLGVLALLGGIVAGIAIAEGTADTELLLVTVGGLILAALAETGLFLLTRGLRRIRAFDQVETATSSASRNASWPRSAATRSHARPSTLAWS